MRGRIFALDPLLFVTLIASAKDRTLVAEGGDIAWTKTRNKRLEHWQLWQLSNGGYEVVDTNIQNASSVRIFRFDSQFLPIGYSKKFRTDVEATSLKRLSVVAQFDFQGLMGLFGFRNDKQSSKQGGTNTV
jgi:hypothetical protein